MGYIEDIWDVITHMEVWDFPWHKPSSYWGIPMAMETPTVKMLGWLWLMQPKCWFSGGDFLEISCLKQLQQLLGLWWIGETHEGFFNQRISGEIRFWTRSYTQMRTMVLEYLPTFTPKNMARRHVGKYSSTMGHASGSIDWIMMVPWLFPYRIPVIFLCCVPSSTSRGVSGIPQGNSQWDPLTSQSWSAWWLVWTPLKNMTSSIGMMTATQYEWENAKLMATKPPGIVGSPTKNYKDNIF